MNNSEDDSLGYSGDFTSPLIHNESIVSATDAPDKSNDGDKSPKADADSGSPEQ